MLRNHDASCCKALLAAWQKASPDTHAAWLAKQEALRDAQHKADEAARVHEREVLYPQLLALWNRLLPAASVRVHDFKGEACLYMSPWKQFTVDLTEDIQSQFEALKTLPLGTPMEFRGGPLQHSPPGPCHYQLIARGDTRVCVEAANV
jgi:hypothetical protein